MSEIRAALDTHAIIVTANIRDFEKAKQILGVQVMPEEAVAQQEVAYLALRQQWSKASSTQIEEVLAKREVVEPELELKPEVIEKLHQRIDEAKQRDIKDRPPHCAS